MASISVVILTFDEEVHIARCIASVRPLGAQVFVVDCGSQDNTVRIARSLGAHVFTHAWEGNQARQLNWAFEALPITTEWVLRLDADEWVSPELANELNERLSHVEQQTNGVVLVRQQYAFGRKLRWGGHPIQQLRIWRHGAAVCEDRWMDEHILLTSGRTQIFEHSISDQNLKPLHWWMTKQANYAVREAADILLSRSGVARRTEVQHDSHNRRKRWLKQNVYQQVPRFCRPFGLFGYRYVLQLGMLDGVHGFAWHVLQGFCYRFLVDTILFDVERRARADAMEPLDVLQQVYNLDARI